MNLRPRATLALFLLSGSVSLAAVHCGSTQSIDDGQFPDSGGGASSACGSAALAGRCGASCTADDACGGGTYCGAGGVCTADCAVGAAACGAGTQCTARGRCTVSGLDPDGPVTIGGGDGGSNTPDACASVALPLTKVEPTILFVIDGSTSMGAAYGDAGSRWNAVRSALIDADGGIIKSIERDVSVGVAFYSVIRNSGPCPRVVETPIALNNHATIAASYTADQYEFAGGTPTGESLDRILGRQQDGGFTDAGFARLTTPGPKIIVLATDGNPDTCADKDDTVGGMAHSLRAVTAAMGEGVKTFVISVGTQVAAAHLQELANAGVGRAPDAGGDAAAPYYTATDKQQFIDAINTIVYGARSCVVTLSGTVKAGQEDKGQLLLNGTARAYGDPNGWRLLPSRREIELLGTSCAEYKTSEGNLAVSFPCGTVDIF
jgi:hypothetical protein